MAGLDAGKSWVEQAAETMSVKLVSYAQEGGAQFRPFLAVMLKNDA
jgi:hypothetical protein